MRFNAPGLQPLFVACATAGLLGSAPALADVVSDSPNGFALRSDKSISLGGANKVFGSVGAAGDLQIGWNSFVDGAIEKGDDRSWESPRFDDWSSGGEKIKLGWAKSIDLRAGSYGSLKAESSTTIGLTAGSYAFDSFSIGWDSTVVADTSQGDVYVLVSGDLTAGDQSRFKASGEGTLYHIARGDASFGDRSDIYAAVYSSGRLSFGGEVNLTGLAYSAGDLSTGYGSNFAYFVPGPASIALIPFAAAVVRGGGRRRRR
ncbi:MAG: hypothetical protein JNK53_07080 [Phycisphaerae bacterium]|nr:hypothetical protein [Phycisphaerae bacterium]